MHHEMKVEASGSRRQAGSKVGDAPATIRRARDAARVLTHRIKDLRVRWIDVDSAAVAALKFSPCCAGAVGLDGAIVLRAADPYLWIGGSQRPVVKLDIGNAGADLRERLPVVCRAEDTVVAAKVNHPRRN